MRRAISLDRDGTLNKVFLENGLPFSPSSFSKFEILPGVKESIIRFKKLNFVCLLVTNQPDVSRGKIKKSVVIKMNNFLKDEIKLDDIFVCYHDDDDNCECRKPKPGLLLDAGKKWGINLNKSYMIGDRWKDVQAGINAGCKTIFIKNNYNENKDVKASFITNKLINAAYILENLKIHKR